MSNLFQEYQVFIFTLLAVVVFVLATYLGFLINKLRLQKKMNELREKELEQLRAQREQSLVESVQIIARAVINEQCEISEGCIRIKKLLELLDYDIQGPMSAIDQLYLELEGFAYLDERDALSKQEKFDQDRKRFGVEDKWEKDFKSACEALLKNMQQ